MLLRTIRKSRWYQLDWLPKGESPAETLQDFLTNENRLSLWSIDVDQSNLARVIAAIAATRDNPQVIDYVMFDTELAEATQIKLSLEPGNTPDEEANRRWHFNALEVSSSQVARLTEALFDLPDLRFRKTKNQVKQAVTSSVKAGFLREADLKPKVRESVNAML